MAIDIFEVIVVGAGPGGTIAAKRCAQHGLKTLLLEKHKVPRYKICSGMVMSRLAQTLIETEFGQIPDGVLATPKYLSGIYLHIVGSDSKKVEHKMPLTWRKDLDHWMTRNAQETGAQVWDGARVTGIAEANDGYIVTIRKGETEHEVRTRFLVGADGATSIVRKSLFPNHRVQYVQIVQECYQGTLDLALEYFHPFYYPEMAIVPSFDVHCKDDVFLLDVTAKTGDIKELDLLSKAKKLLAEGYGFNLNDQPLWTKGCIQPLVYKDLVSGSFSPCKGNALLVGEAGGLLMPLFAADGIREALWSGLLAAASIIKALETGKQADVFYTEELAPILSMFTSIYSWARKIKEQSSKGSQYLLSSLGGLWDDTLNINRDGLVR